MIEQEKYRRSHRDVKMSVDCQNETSSSNYEL